MSEQMTPEAALVRLRQYGERTSTWSTATYASGTERTLHQIAHTLAGELDRVRADQDGAIRAVVDLAASIGEARGVLARDICGRDSTPEEMDLNQLVAEAVAEYRSELSSAERLRKDRDAVRAKALTEAADKLALEMVPESSGAGPGFLLAIRLCVRALRLMSDKAAVS